MRDRAQGKWLIGVLVLASAVVSMSGCGAEGTYRDTNSTISTVAHSSYDGIDDLDSYGTWITLPPYGRVWRPNVTADWAPFYFGHWDYTPPNWTWVSYEPFGWIVYHYGNWFYASGYGWVWIPGNGQWSPARVEWATYDDFVCWAPLPPQGVTLPRPWERYENVDMWNIVHAKDFDADNVGAYRVERQIARPQEQQPRVVNRVPDVKMIERYSGRSVPSVKISREPVKVGTQQLHRMHVSPADQQRADQHKPEVDSHVTRTTGSQRNTGSHR